MSTMTRLDQVLSKSDVVYYNDFSKFVVFSDCHRGDGSKADDFYKNKDVYNAALDYYYRNGFTYIEAGDGDELWENRFFSKIYETHADTFKRLKRFGDEGRLHMIYGNHNMPGLYKKLSKSRNIKFHEGLVLKHAITGQRILITHGHQGDLINDKLWPLARFLVRYIIRTLQIWGINNPISPAVNQRRKKIIEIRMKEWVEKRNIPLIAGHTHRPCIPGNGGIPYYNCGSCVEPGGITCIEIRNGKMPLVKWNADINGTICRICLQS
jgi:UDP-2,3-diacylglucosamine pyrophosphatase LpxH